MLQWDVDVKFPFFRNKALLGSPLRWKDAPTVGGTLFFMLRGRQIKNAMDF